MSIGKLGGVPPELANLSLGPVQTVASPAHPTSVGHRPPEGKRWEFDAAVVDVFADMIRRSIPDHDGMRDVIHRMACRFVKPKTDIVDLGASRGAQVEPLFDKFGALNRFVLVERAPEMLAVLRKRYACAQECGYVRVQDLDLRHDYPAVSASLTLAVLTLQFVPIEHRARVIQDAYDRTLPGGAFIVAEKVLGSTSLLSSTLIDEYHKFKVASGYSPDDVAAKALSLEGSLVPVSAEENERMLRAAGFRHVECVWRRLNFAAWLAVK